MLGGIMYVHEINEWNWIQNQTALWNLCPTGMEMRMQLQTRLELVSCKD